MKNKSKLLVAALAAFLTLPALTSCGVSKDLIGKYTLHEAESGSPETWNPHTWETSTDSVIIGYTEIGLYDFIYNKNEDGTEGYKIVPEMAASLARSEALTQAEAEKYGYEKGEDGQYPTGVKWVIDLNQDAKWADGTPINADSYIYSANRLIDPEMQNRRADNFWQGANIVNAKNRFRSDTAGIGKACDYVTDAEYNADTHDSQLTFVWKTTSNASSLTATVDSNVAAGYGSTRYEMVSTYYGFPATVTNEMLEALDGKTIAQIKADPTTAAQLQQILDWWEEGDAGVLDLCTIPFSNPHYDFDDVGLKKTGDYQITLFLEDSVTDFWFYYYFSGNWLVHEATYEATREKPTGATLYATQYGTSVENYCSYGPYKLVSYVLDKQIVLTRNDQWYGWTDGNHEGQYQTTDIVIDIVDKQATQLLMFEKGEIDSVSLQGSDMDKYGNSSNLIYTPQSYTSKVTLNSSFNYLKENQETKEEANPGTSYNKTVLSNIKFREAISWSLNRLDFVQSMTAGSGVGLGLINDAYIADVDNGTTYRSSEAGKQVFKNVYGDSETGYDEAKAIALFNEAYDEEFASEVEGSLVAGDKVSLLWEVYNDDWMDYINYYIDNITTALQKSKFGTNTDGVTFEIVTSVTGDAFADHIEAGSCEMGMSTWGGNALDPLGLMQVYTDKSLQYEPGFDGTKLDVTVKLDGVEVTHTFQEWYELSNTTYSPSNGSVEDRVAITAAMEEAYLKTWNVVSIYTRQSVSMNSFKINYVTDNYNMFYGYGGIRFMAFNYDDYDWAKLCKENKKNGFDYTR